MSILSNFNGNNDLHIAKLKHIYIYGYENTFLKRGDFIMVSL